MNDRVPGFETEKKDTMGQRIIVGGCGWDYTNGAIWVGGTDKRGNIIFKSDRRWGEPNGTDEGGKKMGRE